MPTRSDNDQLDDRKAAILKSVVTGYVETAQPVGSSQVAHDLVIEVSPATVRADMAALERDGLPDPSPHERGPHPDRQGLPLLRRPSRQPTSPRPGRARAGAGLLLEGPRRARARAPGHLEAARAADRLRGRRRGPGARDPRRPLGPLGAALGPHRHGRRRALQRRRRKAHHPDPRGVADDALSSASAAAPAPLGQLALVRPPETPSGEAEVDELVRLCVSAFEDAKGARDTDQVFVGGAAFMAERFDAIEKVRAVLGILEQSYVVVTLLRDVLAQGQSVSIGSEHAAVESLAECSLVVAPYESEGVALGTIGVLGPTRMDYEHALAAVAVVGQTALARAHAGTSDGDDPGLLRAAWASRARPPRTSSSAPTGGLPASCTRTRSPATPRPRPASSRSPSPMRRFATPSGAGATTCSARTPCGAPGRRGDPTSASRCGLGDLFDAFFNQGFGSNPAARGAASGRGRRDRAADQPRRGRLRYPPRGEPQGARRPATPAAGSGAREGTNPTTCPECRGTRPDPACAPVDPRPDGDGDPVRALQRARTRSSTSPCPDCRGEGRRVDDRTLTVEIPPGVDDGATLRITGAGAAAFGAACRVTSTCTFASSPTAASSARAPTS